MWDMMILTLLLAMAGDPELMAPGAAEGPAVPAPQLEHYACTLVRCSEREVTDLWIRTRKQTMRVPGVTLNLTAGTVTLYNHKWEVTQELTMARVGADLQATTDEHEDGWSTSILARMYNDNSLTITVTTQNDQVFIERVGQFTCRSIPTAPGRPASR